jgi:hypothetical protein
MRRALQRRQRGQALVEYLVIGLVVIAMFFLPWDGNPGSDSVVELMLKAIRSAFAKFLSAISLPL